MSDANTELRKYVDAWYSVFPKGDAAAMSALYTVDARLLLANMAGVRGSKAIGDFVGSFPRYADMNSRFEVTDVDLLSPDIAVVTGAAWVTSKPKSGGDAVQDASRFVMVMKKDPATGTWLCHYDISQHTPDVSPA